METTIFDHPRINQLFHDSRVTKAEVARDLNVRWETIHRACTGKAGVSVHIVKGIANKFGVPLTSLIIEEAIPQKNNT